MSPYIITTKQTRDGEDVVCRDGCDLPLDHEGECYGDGHVLGRSRPVAVATPDEAQDTAVRLISAAGLADPVLSPSWSAWSQAVSAALHLPEGGGTVGLPDGTVIDVKPVTLRTLADDCGFDSQDALPDDHAADVIEAWNAAHGSR